MTARVIPATTGLRKTGSSWWIVADAYGDHQWRDWGPEPGGIA